MPFLPGGRLVQSDVFKGDQNTAHTESWIVAAPFEAVVDRGTAWTQSHPEWVQTRPFQDSVGFMLGVGTDSRLSAYVRRTPFKGFTGPFDARRESWVFVIRTKPQ